MFIVLEWNIFSTFFFFLKKIFQKSPMNMVGYFFHKKKKTEKNTQACLWNMRGSLPLLFKTCPHSGVFDTLAFVCIPGILVRQFLYFF